MNTFVRIFISYVAAFYPFSTTIKMDTLQKWGICAATKTTTRGTEYSCLLNAILHSNICCLQLPETEWVILHWEWPKSRNSYIGFRFGLWSYVAMSWIVVDNTTAILLPQNYMQSLFAVLDSMENSPLIGKYGKRCTKQQLVYLSKFFCDEGVGVASVRRPSC